MPCAMRRTLRISKFRNDSPVSRAGLLPFPTNPVGIVEFEGVRLMTGAGTPNILARPNADRLSAARRPGAAPRLAPLLQA